MGIPENMGSSGGGGGGGYRSGGFAPAPAFCWYHTVVLVPLCLLLSEENGKGGDVTISGGRKGREGEGRERRKVISLKSQDIYFLYTSFMQRNSGVYPFSPSVLIVGRNCYRNAVDIVEKIAGDRDIATPRISNSNPKPINNKSRGFYVVPVVSTRRSELRRAGEGEQENGRF